MEDTSIMKKSVAALSLLSVMLISTTVLAHNGYMGKSVICKDDLSGSSDIVYSATGKARLDVNAISDTTGCNYAKVVVVNIDTGKVTPKYNMYAQNTRFYSAEAGNLKAMFLRGSSAPGKMRVSCDFSSSE